MIDVEALLDSGATGLFINHELVRNNGIAMRVVGRHCLIGQCLWLFVVRVPIIGLVD